MSLWIGSGRDEHFEKRDMLDADMEDCSHFFPFQEVRWLSSTHSNDYPLAQAYCE